MIDLTTLTHNELCDLHAAIEQRLAETARDLIGAKVQVPEYLLRPDTPPERHVAKVVRVNQTKRVLPNVSITPGGAYGGASLTITDIRTSEEN